MTARTYVSGKVRVLELPGAVDLVVNVRAHGIGAADVSVGVYPPLAGDQPRPPAIAWCMGQRVVLQDDAQDRAEYAALWLNDTVFGIRIDQVPVLLNFLGPLVRDAREATNTGVSA